MSIPGQVHDAVKRNGAIETQPQFIHANSFTLDPYVKFSDQQPKGTAGGSSVANGIQIRTLIRTLVGECVRRLDAF